MKLTKTKLKEIVREIMLEDVMDKQIKNPKTGNKIKVRTALQLPGDHPANKMAKKLVAKSPTKKDEPDIDVGGPAYPNVPKGAKSSKQAKVMKQNDSVAKKINPNASNSKDFVMNGMADDIDEFMNEIPDMGQNFDAADRLINLIRDNEQGMRDDDEQDIEDYKKDILKILNTPKDKSEPERNVFGRTREEEIKAKQKFVKELEQGLDDLDPDSLYYEFDKDTIKSVKKEIERLKSGGALNTRKKAKFKESINEEKKTMKLKDLLSEAFENTPRVNKRQTIEGVRNFGIVGKTLYNSSNIMEVAKQLSSIAESAHNHILGEQDDWFDKISVNKNMKTLKGSVVEFQKTAKEAHQLNQRLTALYEDIGHVLNRYYDIDETHVYGHDDEDSEIEEKELDKVDPSKVEPEDDFKDRDDKDIDNDGDVDSSDKYLHKKRQAITKAIKKQKSEGIGGVVDIPALGDFFK